jgi:hypothetical protein
MLLGIKNEYKSSPWLAGTTDELKGEQGWSSGKINQVLSVTSLIRWWRGLKVLHENRYYTVMFGVVYVSMTGLII